MNIVQKVRVLRKLNRKWTRSEQEAHEHISLWGGPAECHADVQGYDEERIRAMRKLNLNSDMVTKQFSLDARKWAQGNWPCENSYNVMSFNFDEVSEEYLKNKMIAQYSELERIWSFMWSAEYKEAWKQLNELDQQVLLNKGYNLCCSLYETMAMLPDNEVVDHIKDNVESMSFHFIPAQEMLTEDIIRMLYSDIVDKMEEVAT